MASSKITRKHIGSKIEFMGNGSVIAGTITNVRNRVATIEFNVPGKWETYVEYLPCNDKSIVSISTVVAYTLSYDELAKAAQA